MPKHDIIVIGASVGGMEALQVLVSGLPPDFGATMLIVWHMGPESLGLLPEVLERAGPLPATNASDGEAIKPGHIYVAPPDHHLLIDQGRTRLTRGPKENRFRPAIDPLFRSAAHAYGPRVIGVVLSGALDDGTAGLWAIKDRGGLAIVQDPLDAIHPSMPQNAMRHVAVDHIVPVRAIAPLLADLTQIEAVEEGVATMDDELEIETRIAKEDNPLEVGVMQLGTPSSFTCPDCHGTLLQITTGDILRFRCHTGHAFSINSLFAQVGESIEEALWNAIRAIEERVMLLQHVAKHSREVGGGATAERLLEQARAAEQQAQLVRLAVLQRDASSQRTPNSAADVSTASRS